MLHSLKTANMNLSKATTKNHKIFNIKQGHKRSFPLPRKLHNFYDTLSQTIVTVLQTGGYSQYEQNGKKLTSFVGSLRLGNKNILHKTYVLMWCWYTNKVQWNVFTEIKLLHSTVNCTAYISLYIGLFNMDMYHIYIYVDILNLQ